MAKFLILCFLLNAPIQGFCKHKRGFKEKQIHRIAEASSDLIKKRPSEALQKLEKVKRALDPETSFSFVLSFILFSEEAVAYDLMRNSQAAWNSLEQLYPCIDAYYQKEMRKNKPSSHKENKKALELFQGIAYLAPSNEVQEFLLSFAHEIARQWREFKLAAPEESVEWEIGSTEEASLEMCSFRKKFAKFVEELLEVLDQITKILERVKEVKDVYDTLKTSINPIPFAGGSDEKE